MASDPAFDVTLNTQDLTSELAEIEKRLAEEQKEEEALKAEDELAHWHMFEGYTSGQRHDRWRAKHWIGMDYVHYVWFGVWGEERQELLWSY